MKITKYFSVFLFLFILTPAALAHKNPAPPKDAPEAVLYVSRGPSGKTDLHVKGADGLEFTIGLPSKIFRTNGKRRALGLTPVRGRDRYKYFYPEKTAEFTDGKMIAAFGNFIIGVDRTAKKYLCSKLLASPPYGIKANAFWFHSKPNLPYVVIESGWEGVREFQLLVDLSKKTVRYYHLYKYGAATLADYKTPFLEWDEKGLTLHFYGEVNIEKNPGVEYIEKFPVQTPGEGTGPYALTKGRSFRIEPGKRLTQK